MSRLALALIMVFNTFAVSACSTYKTAAVPSDPDSGAAETADAPQLKNGQHVRLYLLSGETHEGEVIAVSETQVTLLGKPTNRGHEEHAFDISDIERCEVESLTSAGAFLAVGLVAVFVALGVGIYGMRDWGKGWS